MTDAIRRNTAIAEDFERRADAIMQAQVSESIRQLANTSMLLTPVDVRYAFESNFGNDIISALFLEFCNCITETELIHRTDFAVRPAKFTVAHMQNPNSVLALQLLCKGFEYTSVLRHDFRNCCEDVATGAADYCIMPTASTDDGIFPSFHKLTKAYDLKICGMCCVSCSDREAEMRFALLGRNIECSFHAHHHCIDFSFLPDRDELACIISALSGAGCKIEQINTYPTEFSIDKSECIVSVSCKDISPATVLLFLEAVLPGHTVLGVY